MELPISSLLKSRNELETAQLEDEVVDMLFGITDKISLHGGTAVWRCYGGKRFSKDIDAYIWAEGFREKFIERAERIGIEVTKFREKRITYIHVRKGDTEIKIEPNNAEKTAILVPYERIDGSRINVLALSPEDLVIEKIAAYSDRRAYKDLYDITVLLNHIKFPEKIKGRLSEFAKRIPSPDEEFQTYASFRSVIYAGTVPSYERMVEFIRRWTL
jgi:predicted nucleotidyltransferase component of viral defense system